ncbi:tRNA synthetases class I (M)-domain-containing protein [Ustulina deusta]|nr:tRNA synthetases class I (M)-domain-containing protein [Ustulina deusta]
MGSTTQPILPEPGKRNILITSALPYVNNTPHLGNIIGSVLSADCFARYCRARGLRTLFICGSDEYGTATETKALSEGVTPAELCAKYHTIHKGIYDWFRIDFSIFGRTPTAQHTEIVQDIFKRLWSNGFIEERETIQPYCPKHEYDCACPHAELFNAWSLTLAFKQIVSRRSVYARGDQCDACGNLLDPLQPAAQANDVVDQAQESKPTGWLINPRCKLDGATPEARATKHLFLRLDALKDDVVSWFRGANKEWSANCVAITESWISRGLQARGITRDLKWGVPIPKGCEGLSEEEYRDKVFYVWFDACIGYPSITKNYTDGDNLEGTLWTKWWKNPEDVTLYQFMGKDNVPFHSIIFPASQLGTKENWTKVGRFSTTEYLNYEGGKFSKSRNIGVFGNSAQLTGIDADIWRFFLLSRRPETSDAEFKWDEFIDVNNNDLLKNLGNFVNRVVKFAHAKLDGTIPNYRKYTEPSFEQYKADVNAQLQNYITAMEAIKLRQGLQIILSISALGNQFLQSNKLSNQTLAEQHDKCTAVVGLALNHVLLLANLLTPYMPETARSMLQQVGVEVATFSIPDIWTANTLEPGQKIGAATLLFSQIPAARAEEWRETFGGDELKKLKAAEAEKAAAKKAAKQKKKEQKNAQKAAEKAAEKAAVDAAATASTAADTPAPTDAPST